MGQPIGSQEEDEFVRLVEKGVPLRTAANAIGRQWTAVTSRIRKSPGFSARVRRARAKLEERLIDAVDKHTDRDWKAAMALLERQFPSRWGRPEARPNEADANATAASSAASDRETWVEMNMRIPGRALPQVQSNEAKEDEEESLEDI